MTSECLVAAQLWIDELEKQRAVAVARKWAALAEFALDDADAYQDRDAELDRELIQPVRVQLQQARGLLEARAEKLCARETWPAGGSWLSRAYALARSLADLADPALVDLELAQLRRAE